MIDRSFPDVPMTSGGRERPSHQWLLAIISRNLLVSEALPQRVG